MDKSINRASKVKSKNVFQERAFILSRVIEHDSVILHVTEAKRLFTTTQLYKKKSFYSVIEYLQNNQAIIF